MSWRERELSQCVLCVLIFHLAIYQSAGFTVSTGSEISPPLYPVESRSIHTLSSMDIGSVHHPPVISPSKPEILSLIIQEIVPSVQPSVPSGHATKLHISSTTVSPSDDSLQLHIPHGTGFSGSPAAEISVHSTKQMAVTPSYHVDSRSAHEPSPMTLPIVLPTLKPEAVSRLSPIIQEIVPSVQPCVPSLHIPLVSISPSTNIQLAHDPHGIGSTSNPPSTLLPNSKAVTPINHAAAPSIPSSPLIDATKDHNSQRQITDPEGKRVPNVSHIAAHDLSLSHGNPQASKIRDGVAIRRRSPNVSPLTQHAPALSPRMLPFASANVLSNSPGLPPSITYPPSTKGFNGSGTSPVAAPSLEISVSPIKNSRVRGSSTEITPLLHEANTTSTPSTSHPPPPDGKIIHSPKHAPAILPPEHKDVIIGGQPGSGLFNLPPPPSQQSAYSHTILPIQKNKRRHYAPPPYVLGHVVSPAPLSAAQTSNKRENYAPTPNFWSPKLPPFHPPLPFPRNNEKPYAPLPNDEVLVISFAPSHPPKEFLKSKKRHLVPSPNFDGPEINRAPSHAPIPSPKLESLYASPPYIGGPVINPAPLHPSVEISKSKIKHYAPPPYVEGPVVNSAPMHSPMETPRSNRRHYAPSPYTQGPYLSPVQSPFSSSNGEKSASYSPEPSSPPSYIIWQIYSPEPSPSSNFKSKSWAPSRQPPQVLPPPPPNLDCGPMTCQQPLTNPSPGSPCACVLPIKVGLRLGIALYIFFPLVSEFAKEIASGISMKQSQVRIMGANSATVDTEKTDVLIDLVPLVKSFNNITIFLIYEKFWRKKVAIQASYFGDYDVLYVSYPGLPPSPPTAPTYVDGEAYRSNNTPKVIQPLGVDVRRQKEKHSGSLIAIIALSSVIALFFIIGAAWLLLFKNKELLNLSAPTSQSSQPPFAKSPAAGTVPTTVGSEPSSTLASFSPSVATYTGSAKTFTLAEMERTTNRFDDSRVIGEGGFGRVYQGTLQDGTLVAVKVLKRDDQQGEREFLAEVEMLSRLHHRNLVKLIGICTEESIRCLVYELIPNGSVESHLHGVDKITAPLDWDARVKIALGAARGLAYLHEDSIPRVIHRDFKSSNILLEHDFTPKVSDFGLAKSALEEGKEHISTRVMGTFGYLAPEYAMTGHLLFKSDVYSYGVVLLELLTGRKPVDMSQPPGQENLVAWAHPLLTNTEELETITDPALGTDYPRDRVAKVAAIASMCVQPEVSHRPFMSEVVQALKLVCNKNDEIRQSESCSNDELPMRDVETGISVGLCQGSEREMPESHVLYTSSKFRGDASGSFRRYSSSGPLRTDRSRLFWQRVRGLASGSSSEHGFTHRFWFRTHQGGRWS